MDDLVELERWLPSLSPLWHLVVAYVLALPVAWNREAHARSAGLRTFPLVAVGACGYVLLGRSVLEGHEPQARVIYGVITGIGFVGGGAILKSGERVSGTATAASIWNTGAIGVAVAWNQFLIAVVLSLMNLVTLVVLGRFKGALDHEGRRPRDPIDGEETPVTRRGSAKRRPRSPETSDAELTGARGSPGAPSE